jgi:twinkle protein
MAYVNTHLPCPVCNSSDAYSIDDKGWGNCFSCNHRRNESGITTLKVVSTNRNLNAMKHNLDIQSLPDRKLSFDTCKFYGVGFKGDDLYFPIDNEKAYKVRINGDKQFKIDGNFADAKQLFGQDKFVEGGKFVVVTEGELDAMSFYQMSGRYCTPSVSVRNGAQSALKDVKTNYEFLNSFETIVFWFDNDEPGIKSVKECAEVFGAKAKIVQGMKNLKDCNDYLVANKSAEAMKQFWNAKTFTPDGIINGDTLLEEVVKPIEKPDCMYPYKGLNELTYGIRKGELVTITAGSGLGKSQFLREIVHHIYKNTDDTMGLMFMEESPRKTALSIMSLHANKPLHLPTTESTTEEKQQAFDATLASGRFFMFEHFGSSEIDNIVNRVKYMAKVMDCKYIFLDHVSIIVSAQSNGDERKAIDEIMTKLRTLVEETGICLFVVSHLKRPENKGHEEGASTSLSQLRGSASIAQLSDMVIGLERNGQADDMQVRNTTHVRVLKNRFAGITGKACDILYSLDTGRMTETFEDDAL